MKSSASVHHIMSHELKGLEAFIAQGLMNLPKLTTETSVKNAYQTSSTYHTKCSGLLREVLQHVDQFSPKHCKLIAEIWEVSSVNVLMLLKVCQAALQEKIQVKEDFAQFNRFTQKCSAEQSSQIATLSAAIDTLKAELREAKAEVQTITRRLARAILEKERMEKVLDRVTRTVQETLEDGQLDMDRHDEIEEQDFLLGQDDINLFQEATPLESIVEDIDKLSSAVEEENKIMLSTLGDLDRYIDSNLVSILWKHQAQSHRNPFVEKLFRVDVKWTQTDDELLHGPIETQLDIDDDLQSPRMRKKILAIPICIRSMLDNIPKVQKMLGKHTLNHIILNLYLRKMDNELTKPNITFPHSIRDYFLYKFGLKSLADFHLVEMVKSCIYYRRKLENFSSLYDTDKSGCNLKWDDARLLLFGRFLNIFPDESLCSYMPHEGIHIMLDYISDVIEIDPSIPSLHHLQDMIGPVTLNRENVIIVWKTHFSYMDPDTINRVEYDLNEHERDNLQQIDFDWTLSYIMYQWSEFELQFDSTIRQAFRDVLTATNLNRTNLLLQMDGFISAVQQVWPECNEIEMENLYMDMMATKRENFRLASEKRKKDRLKAIKTTHVAATTVLGIDGVFEEEFVAHVGKIMRARRVKWGIRTRGQLLWHPLRSIWIGGSGKSNPNGFQESNLKPGTKP